MTFYLFNDDPRDEEWGLSYARIPPTVTKLCLSDVHVNPHLRWKKVITDSLRVISLNYIKLCRRRQECDLKKRLARVPLTTIKLVKIDFDENFTDFMRQVDFEKEGDLSDEDDNNDDDSSIGSEDSNDNDDFF